MKAQPLSAMSRYATRNFLIPQNLSLCFLVQGLWKCSRVPERAWLTNRLELTRTRVGLSGGDCLHLQQDGNGTLLCQGFFACYCLDTSRCWRILTMTLDIRARHSNRDYFDLQPYVLECAICIPTATIQRATI
eukprot:4220130-Amphidinium_carterae.1